MLSRRFAIPLILLAVLALLTALWAGLLRLGWALPVLRPTLPMAHGPLMVCGFLGTLVSLERAVGLSALGGRRWTYAAPALTGLGALLLIVGVPGLPGPLLITLGSLVLAAAMVAILRIHATLHAAVMLVGAVAWVAGNVLWLFGQSIPQVVLWWAGFLILTIVGERLELSRLLRLARAVRGAFVVAVAILVIGMALSAVAYAPGVRLASLGMLALATWLLAFDMARRTVRKTGLTRYIAASLLAGYVWLAAAGLLGLRYAGVTAGPQYDAFLHTVFVGFVFSMIFAHAPIIFPAVLGIPIPYSPRFYLPLVLLQASLVLRVGGDLAGLPAARQWGGLLNEVAILAFIAILALSARRGRSHSGHAAAS
jgi:hypothetical protein